MTLPSDLLPISIADINVECGEPINTTHGLDWVFEITRPEERPAASGYTPVNVTDIVSGGTVAIANSNLNYYRAPSPPDPAESAPETSYWAYFNQNFRNSNCSNGNCNNCTADCNCGNIASNCSTTPLADCVVPDTRAWLQKNCNCACTFNCDQVTYSYNCNCACPWICACACW